MRKLYCAFVIAVSHQLGNTGCLLSFASDNDAATVQKTLIDFALERYPKSEGWESHQVLDFQEINDEAIENCGWVKANE